MINVMFVCLGNICRSPMAEFILKDMVRKRGIADDESCRSIFLFDILCYYKYR